MSTLGLYCSLGNCAKCGGKRCDCTCHGGRTPPGVPMSRGTERPTPPPIRAGGIVPNAETRPRPTPTQERTVPDTIGEAARVLEDRIADIDEQLSEQDDLRAERKKLETALRKLRPKAGRADGEGGPSLASRILAVIANDKKAEWSLSDILSQVELSGWTTTSSSPLQVLRPTCDKLVRSGQLTRPRGGVYKAKA